jgi:hypothetical protein
VALITGAAVNIINIKTDEREIIHIPTGWEEKDIGSFRDLTYDNITNSLHMISQHEKHIASTYCILHLDDYSWEEVFELGNDISYAVYDPIKELIYIKRFFINYELSVFDLINREFLDKIPLPYETREIFAMYGSPIKILAPIFFETDNKNNYYILDTKTKTSTEFFNIGNINGFGLNNYISIGDENFITINIRRYSGDIIILDLNKGTHTLILDSFPYKIYALQKIENGKYSFMLATDDRRTLLCFIDYP